MAFEEAVAQVLQDEGGYFKNSKTGEIVNMGITLKFINAVVDKTATENYIKNLTVEQAKDIYLKYFWLAIKLDKIKNDKVAGLIFYLGVNCGTPSAIMMVQRSCNILGKVVKVDGGMGPLTLAAINFLDPLKLYNEICNQAEARYRDIAKTPLQAPFLTGW